jgi:hypothetical protein
MFAGRCCSHRPRSLLSVRLPGAVFCSGRTCRRRACRVRCQVRRDWSSATLPVRFFFGELGLYKCTNGLSQNRFEPMTPTSRVSGEFIPAPNKPTTDKVSTVTRAPSFPFSVCCGPEYLPTHSHSKSPTERRLQHCVAHVCLVPRWFPVNFCELRAGLPLLPIQWDAYSLRASGPSVPLSSYRVRSVISSNLSSLVRGGLDVTCPRPPTMFLPTLRPSPPSPRRLLGATMSPLQTKSVAGSRPGTVPGGAWRYWLK